MSAIPRTDDEASTPLTQQVDQACDRFEAAWKAGGRPRIEEFLDAVPEPGRPALLRHLLVVELQYRLRGGERPMPEDYRPRFPGHEGTIAAAFDVARPTPPQVGRPRATPERDTGRHLLFGLLALQNHFVDREALLAAFNTWIADKSRSLGRVLVEQGALTPARQALLESLVQEHLATHGGDVETSLAAAEGLGAVRGALGRITDPELHATLDRVACAGRGTARDSDTTLTYAVDASAAAGSRFTILRPHAQGGLGQVSVARDQELNREVALKEIRPEHADDPHSRARFVLEAEVTGRLEHPGVVPVYGLGCDAQGRPFYAMRFVKGQSLKEAIAQFHSTEPSGNHDPRRWNLELRQLLNRFVAVCNVVAYAHSRGVIHRDLKPANILLGPYGETLVVDWGLAKVVGRGEAAPKDGAAELTLQPTSGSGSSETLPGTALGTPAYMSPEQAEGRLERVGPLSDVYSLGATLYCLLTGQPPIDETEVGAALRRVERGEFPSPRAIRPSSPRGLEAICLKAMALKPEDRYVSARAFAEDLEHWLADEPIGAARDPVLTRLARWGRRHKTLAAGIGALLVTAVVALAISTVLIGREQALTRERAEDLRRKDYINRVNLAHREVLDDNVAQAEDLLEGCPTDLRNWEWHYVRRLCHTERLTYRSHFEYVRCLAVSPDGKWVASGAGMPRHWSADSERGEVRLWDVESGQDRHVFPDLPGTVQTVAFSPDGKLVAAGGGFYDPPAQGWLKVWDATSGKVALELTKSGTTVMSLAFHPKGQPLLAAGYGLFSDEQHVGNVQLHHLLDGAPEGTAFGKLVGGVNAVAFHPDGRRLALAGLERIEIWDAETRVRVQPLTGHTKWVYCVAFHPDGNHLASGGWDNTIKLWDLTTGAAVRTIEGHRGFVEEIAFSPDGKQLASVSEDKSVRLWDPASGRELTRFHGHVHYVNALAFHPDGRHILSGSQDGTVKVWDTVTVHPIVFRGHSRHITSVEFRDGHNVVSKDSPPIGTQFGPSTAVTTKVWDLNTGEEEQTNPTHVQDRSRARTDAAVSGPSRSRLSPKGTLLAEARQGPLFTGTGCDVEVRHTSSGKVAFTLKGHTALVVDVVFSPDSSRIVTGSDDRTVKLWDTETGQEVLTLRGHTAGVTCVAFSPDGKRLVSGGFDTLVNVWDARPLPESIFTEAKAHRLVQSRLFEWPQKSELIAQLRLDPDLDDLLRAAALRIAEHIADQPQHRRLFYANLRIVQNSGRDFRDYQKALRWAEEGSRLFPAPRGWPLIHLGAAYYRLDRFQDALDTFDRAEPLYVADRSLVPVRRVFRVMTLHRLGRRDEARFQLSQLLQQFQERPWEFSRSRILLREAIELIDPQPVGPK